MIHDEICTYEVCKLAKEKGFGEMASCYQGYRKDGTLFYFSNMPDGKERVMQMDCLAPTQSLLQRWLREEKGIHISVEYEWVEGVDDWTFWSYIKKINNAKVVNDAIKSGFDTYELALEDALKFALKNLV